MSSALTISSTLPIKGSEYRIPQLGFGVYRSAPSVCEASCEAALQDGYLHIDTAQFYRNETQVGKAVQQQQAATSVSVSRESLYLTSKILSAAGSVEASLQKCRESVAKLDPRPGGYVDLFLIHSPNAGAAVRKELWLALEKLKAEGLTRNIGVSNYGRGHIEEMKEYASVWPPVVNQIELHPWCQQREAVAYCTSQGILLEAYAPLTRMQRAYESVLEEIAHRHGKKTTHVLVRYALQKGWVPLVKSDNPTRIKDNANVYDFELTSADMTLLDDQDQGAEGAIVQAVVNDV